MTYEHILIEMEDGVGIVTLNRPDKLNAMNRQLSSELHDAMKRMEADEAIGCIVITGAGERAFSAGGTFTSSARMTAATPRRSWTRTALRAAAAMKLPPAQSRRSG
jgi:enoyl-CoA hydratase/carnithine racemase